MKIVKGKQTKPQRVVIYGVESVGKSTFAANFPAPLFLDVEGGTAHLDTTRAEIGSAVELDEALAACKGNEYQTIIIDSADWAERLVLEHMLVTDKKKSVEDYGYGKGFVMLAEKFSRLLSVADQLIAASKHVVFIAHSKVQRVEPPDLMSAYDRFELKLTKQSAPLLKEWADELWFFKFKTKTVESESGPVERHRRQGAHHSNDSLARPTTPRPAAALAEELPMTWESVAHLFAASKPAAVAEKEVPAWQFEIERHGEDVNAFLRDKGMINSGQKWRDAGSKALARIESDPAAFFAKVREWKGAQ
jgi:hypothetical protein